MTNHIENANTPVATDGATWQLNALTEALGDLTLTVSDSLSVGRGSDNDVVLGSKQVSRNHAVLSVLNGELYVKDLESSNGTFINEQRIEANKSTNLAANDTLGFASFSFQVSAPVAATLANEQAAPLVTDEPALSAGADVVGELATSAAAIPVVKEAVIKEPVDKETKIEEFLPVADTPAEPIEIVEAEPVVEKAVVEESVVEEATIEQAVVKEPVVKETGVDEVLSATDNSSEAIPVEAAPIETAAVVTEPTKQAELKPTETIEAATSAPVVEEPIQKAARQAPEEADAAKHDKTTKTALQEEADPDVLRAKQAATSQFSGTANLGQPRDLGTAGNNAMDQAINNPANAGQVEKKPSGGWFIWVFVAVLIIGLALWLFNMGIV